MATLLAFTSLRSGWFVPVLLSASLAHASELQPLDDGDLGQVVAREGVSLDFFYRMNANEDGSPVAALNDCQTEGAGNPNPCAIAITVDQRPGMWVMMKDMYGVQKVNSLWMDGGRMEDDGGTLKLRTVHGLSDLSNRHADPTRFHDESGNCMLKPGAVGNDCNVSNLPALVMQYGNTDGSFLQPDVEWSLNIGRVTVQYDVGATPAYMLDQPGSFMSYKIGDFRGVNHPAEIFYDGAVLMYGF